MLRATYQDGYTHDEQELADISPYIPGKNIFDDIYYGRPELEHGPLVKLELFHGGQHYDIDWTQVPAGARPIRFKEMERDFNTHGWLEHPRITRIGFGYQWTVDGKNYKRVRYIT